MSWIQNNVSVGAAVKGRLPPLPGGKSAEIPTLARVPRFDVGGGPHGEKNGRG